MNHKTRMHRPVQIRTRTGEQASGHYAYMISVPWQIAESIPEGMLFRPHVTPAGLLFQPLGVEPEVVDERPAWARKRKTGAPR